jgi:hypothetical protein
MKTPDEEVAERIIAQFRKEALLSEEELKKLYPSLVAGELQPEDWRFTFEAAMPNRGDSRGSKSK